MKRLKYNHALVHTYKQIASPNEDPYCEDAVHSLSVLRIHYINMDFKSFVNYYESLCTFIRTSGFFYKEYKWHKEHKRFTTYELSDYYMDNYYYKLISHNEVVGDKLKQLN
jgi:hypothetical protein